MAGAGLTPESAKGECNLGQHEIAFRYAEALTCADHHVIYKNGAKEIAAQEGMSITFMAKPNAARGQLLPHPLLAARRRRRPAGGLGDGPATLSPTMAHAMAGLLATMREFTLLYAPNINSYKRYQAGSFAPTAVRWGTDNRTCSLRVVGHGASLRVENRVPGADVNPYLAIAALVAGALHGIEQRAAAGGRVHRQRLRRRVGAARAGDAARGAGAVGGQRRWPGRRSATRSSTHYANNARVELAAFDAAVTDWELVPRLRTALRSESDNDRPGQPGHRGGRRDRAGHAARGDRRGHRAGARRRSERGGPSRPATGPGCCAGSPSIVDEHIEELAELEVRNSGHTIGNARWEAGNVRDVLDYYAGAPERLIGPADPGRRRAWT